MKNMHKPEFCSELKLRHEKTGDFILMVIFFDKNLLRWTRENNKFEINFTDGEKMKAAIRIYLERKKQDGWREAA